MLTETHSETQGLYVGCQELLDKQTKAQDTQQVAQLTLGIDSCIAEPHLTVNASGRVQSTAIPRLLPLGNQLLQHLAHSRASNPPAELCIVLRLVTEVGAPDNTDTDDQPQQLCIERTPLGQDPCKEKLGHQLAP